MRLPSSITPATVPPTAPTGENYLIPMGAKITLAKHSHSGHQPERD
jgi:hypothetical protein